MKLLHLDSSILGDQSVSRQLTASVVQNLRTSDPSLQIISRDLTAEPIPHLTLATLPSANAGTRQDLNEFLEADIVVIGAPMYNFTLPSQLKAWIDRIVIAGETFRYSEQGPEGLIGDKRVIIILSRGGLYGAGAALENMEHLETYLRGIFGFLGVSPQFITADGISLGPDQRAEAIENALAQAANISAGQ